MVMIMTKNEFEVIKKEEIVWWTFAINCDKPKFLTWWMYFGMYPSPLCNFISSRGCGSRANCEYCPLYTCKPYRCNINWCNLNSIMEWVFRDKFKYDEELYVKCKKYLLDILSDVKVIEYEEELIDI